MMSTSSHWSTSSYLYRRNALLCLLSPWSAVWGDPLWWRLNSYPISFHLSTEWPKAICTSLLHHIYIHRAHCWTDTTHCPERILILPSGTLTGIHQNPSYSIATTLYQRARCTAYMCMHAWSDYRKAVIFHQSLSVPVDCQDVAGAAVVGWSVMLVTVETVKNGR